MVYLYQSKFQPFFVSMYHPLETQSNLLGCNLQVYYVHTDRTKQVTNEVFVHTCRSYLHTNINYKPYIIYSTTTSSSICYTSGCIYC